MFDLISTNHWGSQRQTITLKLVGCGFRDDVVNNHQFDGISYTRSNLPMSLWWDQGSQHTFQYLSPLTGTTYKYTLSSTTGASSVGNINTQNGVTTVTVTGSGTITGSYAKTKK